MGKPGSESAALRTRQETVLASDLWPTLQRLLKDPYLWVIVFVTALHTFLHYATYIETLRPYFRDLPYFSLHSLHEVEFIAIIALAAYRYRWKGGLTMVGFTIAASVPFLMTPYIFGRDPRPNELRDRTIEIMATLGIGGFITFLIEVIALQKERGQRAWQERQASVNRLITLNSVSQTVNRALDVKSTVMRILEGVAGHVHGRAFFLYLYDKDATALTLAGQQTVAHQEVTYVSTIGVDESLARYLEQPIALFRRGALPPTMRFLGDVLAALGMSAYAIVPLRLMDELLGVMICSSAQALPADDVALLSSLGHIIGLAIRNAQTSEAKSGGAGTL